MWVLIAQNINNGEEYCYHLNFLFEIALEGSVSMLLTDRCLWHNRRRLVNDPDVESSSDQKKNSDATRKNSVLRRNKFCKMFYLSWSLSCTFRRWWRNKMCEMNDTLFMSTSQFIPQNRCQSEWLRKQMLNNYGCSTDIKSIFSIFSRFYIAPK